MKFPFFKSKKDKESADFTCEMRSDRVFLAMLDRGKSVPVSEWSRLKPGAASAIATVCGLDEAFAIVDDHTIEFTPSGLAELGAATGSALNLPSPTPLALDIKAIGRIDEDGFIVQVTWVRLGGQPIRATVEGALLRADGQQWRIPQPLYACWCAAKALTQPTDKANRFRALAALKACWPEGTAVTSESYLQDLRVHYASAMSLKLKTLTPNRTDFDPILFGPAADLPSEDRQRDEEWDNLLTPRAQKLFAENRFRRESEGRPVYVLRDGEYVFIDPELRPILNSIRTLQDRPEAERRNFVLNPRAVLRTLIGEARADELPLDELFVETQQYSDRVAGVDLWRVAVLPWMVPSHKNHWLPERFGLKVADDYYAVSPDKVEALVSSVSAAAEAGQPKVDVSGLLQGVAADSTPPSHLPVNDQVLAAISHLKPFAAGTDAGSADEASSPAEEIWPGKLFLIVKENFEEVAFAPRETPEGTDSDPVSVPSLLRTPLKPHQVEGLGWLAKSCRLGRRGGLLADDMGLGKTLQAIAFMAWLQAQRLEHGGDRSACLIVAPTGLLGNWRDEIAKHLNAPGLGRLILAFGGDLKLLREEADLSQRDIETGRASLDAERWREGGVVLTTYETLRDYHFSFARTRFGLIVFDEIQKLKNPVSQMTRASKTLNADFVLGMTGTPVENRLQDLWSIMDVISPGLLGASRDFERRFPPDQPDKLANLKALLTKDTDGQTPYMLRRMKSEVLGSLPAKHVHTYRVAMPPVQADTYRQVVVRAAALSASGAFGKGGMLQVLANMRGVSLHPVNPEQAPDSLDIYARDSARLTKALEILDMVCERKEKALIFVEDLAMQDRLAGLIQARFKLRTLPKRINGGVPGPKRQDMVRAFQGSLDPFDVMILSPKAGGVGLTLTQANHVIHLSRWWNPAVEDQATDRVYRIGQAREVHVHIPLAVHPDPVLAETSFDLRLDALLSRKRQLTQDLFSPPEADENDLMVLFGEVTGTQDAAEPAAPAVEVLAPEREVKRQTLSLPDAPQASGARKWKALAGTARPTAEILSIFKGRVIVDMVIKDPYALATPRARQAHVSFVEDIAKEASSLGQVTIEYVPDLGSADDSQDRRDIGGRFALNSAGRQTVVRLKSRPKRSGGVDFHDRSVELSVRHAGGAVRKHELWIGRGVEALYHDGFECSVSYFQDS
ncbi:hypothetical protein ABAC460_09255 [Asticcacaulis sp. AC460]|uniref:DEAD/DEAH box helicase n=1 Tax=Asticcacaulis sp. AC460 TaxID=1282360 RepID=UPI0003C3DAE1|nr:DEAD/DEAH box helicase [Asticcacaulis sp. AC460]ESQ90331.1 hypothetical protein ABAC460_09255 [Asticcacaulis sp. AC460]